MVNRSSSGRVLDVLRERILTGAVAPGTTLSQVQLAEEFGVSRIPVRDAVQLLAGEGLVVLHPGGGATVREMSIAELQELYEMREAIEPLATGLAVPNVGRAEVLRMGNLLEAMAATDDARAWLAANADFHGAVYGQANRPRMVDLVEQLRKLTDRYLHLHLEVIGNTEHLHEEHTHILEAVRDGAAREAAELTRRHLQTSHDFILQYLLEHEVGLQPPPAPPRRVGRGRPNQPA